MKGQRRGNDVVAGRYELVDPIASGGSGTVWRAYDHEREQWCAAKVMRQRHAGEVLRFAREQAVRLHHPHIVSPYAWAADDGAVLIASELVDGGSLQTLLGDWGPLDEPTVVALLDQLLSALAGMHDAGLVHRDVKPGNVLLRATGEGALHCLLTDFGLTIGANEPRLTQTGMVIGTPGYLPPEVMGGRARPHPSHDVYAAGRLALTLTLGDETRPDAGAAGAGSPSGDDERLERVLDPQLQSALRMMTQADPAGRPRDAHAAVLLLMGLPRSRSPRTVEGDEVSVLDQLPSLVEPSVGGLGVTDPSQAHRHGDPRDLRDDSDPVDNGPITPVRVSPTRPQPHPSPALSRSRTEHLTDALLVLPAGEAVSENVPETVSEPVSPPTPTPAPAWVTATQSPKRGRRRSRLVAGGATVPVALAGGTAVAVGVGWGPFADPSSKTIPSGDSSTATVITTVATSGQACGWQQQGDEAESAGGRLTCRLVDGAYVWGR